MEVEGGNERWRWEVGGRSWKLRWEVEVVKNVGDLTKLMLLRTFRARAYI